LREAEGRRRGPGSTTRVGSAGELEVIPQALNNMIEVSVGTKLVSEATGKLNAMMDGIRENRELVEAISTATKEQFETISEVATAVRQTDEMTQHNAALVEETNAAIEQTEAQAGELDTLVEVFVIGDQARGSAILRPKTDSNPVEAMQQKVRTAAAGYLTKGNAGHEEWSEF